MFIVSLSYTAPLEEVDAHLAAHRDFLAAHYANGTFLMSGRKVPRDGGIIVANAPSRAALDAVLGEDPFARAGVARYEVTEFVPTMTVEALSAWRVAQRAA
ncbi:YciI family protein [Massilia sp. Dwa41.01b]|uniref:YciI family protein n=1 Tax=Massilia sp. Dwa41.01b TaxID=2709302 RepID=UPI0016013303|nr:YciI family protein [Massilia sp. Dwa41.01b]QNA88530.1 YciI family protein [Massilia sp. Dwa41.01b]